MVKPRICVVITAKKCQEVSTAIERLSRCNPDIIEIRLDYIDDKIKLNELRGSTKTPLIATYRKHDEGGVGSYTEDERIQILMEACKNRFDYVDMELSTDKLMKYVEKAKLLNTQVIISHHDFDTTPSLKELQVILHQMQDNGADLCKIIGTVNKFQDNIVYLRLLEKNKESRLITFGMGQKGSMSRVFSPLFGAEFTFASMGEGSESASGQISLQELKEIYRMLGV